MFSHTEYIIHQIPRIRNYVLQSKFLFKKEVSKCNNIVLLLLETIYTHVYASGIYQHFYIFYKANYSSKIFRKLPLYCHASLLGKWCAHILGTIPSEIWNSSRNIILWGSSYVSGNKWERYSQEQGKNCSLECFISSKASCV